MAPEILTFVPATIEVTPVFVMVTVSVALTTVLIPVPPAISTVSPSEITSGVPVSPVKLNELIVPVGNVPNVPSPRTT